MENLTIQINKVIDSDIRPYLKSHNGDIEVVNVIDGIVEVKFLGACSGCAMADTETILRVEEALMSKIDGIKAVRFTRELNSELIDLAKSILGITSR